MGQFENGGAKSFVDVIRDAVRQELSDRDSTAVCVVESVNENGTLNLYVLPDRQKIVRNIVNQCRYNFNPGDTALLYLINNRLSNSFVVAKYNVTNESSVIDDYLSTKSRNPVENRVITQALAELERSIGSGGGGGEWHGQIDPFPTEGSTNPVSSGGVYASLPVVLDCSTNS